VKNKKVFLSCMTGLLVLQLILVFWFCIQKQGYHYDEYYSYYSSNVTYALVPTDMEWMDTDGIRSEFMVLEGENLSYGMVKFMQSLDVHPPLYYYLLRTICWLSKGVFSKWQGLSINIAFFVFSWILLATLTKEVTKNDRKKIIAVCAIFGFSPAIFSGIMFIRMYMMLTCICLLTLYIHVRSIMKQKRTIADFYLPVCVLAFIGFYTHYYYAVFLFFLAAMESIRLFIHKESRKEAFFYAGSVLTGLFVAVLLYPACLKHIFRGYRGTEAQDAFFDFKNIGERFSFFFELTNEYVFGNVLVILLLCLLLFGLTKRALISEKETAEKSAVMMILLVTLGYFLVVAKTALLNAEEAIRYEMPVYGLLILLIVLGLGEYLEAFEKKWKQKWFSGVFAFLVLLTILGEILGLVNGKVCFLYSQDKENVIWAESNSEAAVAYIYNPGNRWMIWDESEELMQYEQIYFVSSDNESVTQDVRLSKEDTVYLYVMRGDDAERIRKV